MNVDWIVTDCVKFKDLVLEKDFVSIIKEFVLTICRQSMAILRLRLIDVSTDKNIYIDKLLVEEKRAKHIEGLGSSFLACYTSRQTEISAFFMYC